MEKLWIVAQGPFAAQRRRLRIAFPAVALAVCAAGMLAYALPGTVKAVPSAGNVTAKWNGGDAGSLLRVAQASDFKVLDVIGREDDPIPLKITLPANSTATYSFLMFQGLPPKFTISAGFATKNQWAVSLHDVAALKLIPPTGYTGSFTLDVLLMKGKDMEPERRAFRVEVLANGNAPETTATVSSQVLTSHRQELDSPAVPPARKAPVAQPMDDEDRLVLERGDLLFRQGDVAAARLIYHRLAKKGFAQAALAMARTYDPEVLKALKVEGLQPNVAQARVWYKLADELGSPQAKARLSTLRD